MGEVDKTAVRPLTHRAEQSPVVADATTDGRHPDAKKPTAGVARGKPTTWSKAPADDSCKKIPKPKLNRFLDKLSPAVKARNLATDGITARETKNKIHDIVFDNLPNIQPRSLHLSFVSDPSAARSVDACITSHFDGVGGADLRDVIRDAQYVRVITGLVRLDSDIKERRDGSSADRAREHANLKSAIIADASDFVVGPRADEKDLDAAAVKAKRIHRLGELVQDQLGQFKDLDEQLFADMVRQCAEGIPVSSEDIPLLKDMLSKHKGEPVYAWLDNLPPPQ